MKTNKEAKTIGSHQNLCLRACSSERQRQKEKTYSFHSFFPFEEVACRPSMIKPAKLPRLSFKNPKLRELEFEIRLVRVFKKKNKIFLILHVHVLGTPVGHRCTSWGGGGN